MRPPRLPPARWLCVLVGALACALGPAGGWEVGLQQEVCDYMQMIEGQHNQCLKEAQLENETTGCSKMWDNLTCWPATPRGQVVVLACPLIFKLFSPIQGRNVSRSCTDEGWMPLEPGPYPVACGLDDNASRLDEQQTMFYSSVKTGYTVGYSLSLATLLVATAILSLFRKLHCTRNYIHMHLFISFILRATAVFIKDLALFDSGESDHCSKGSVGCKAAVVLFQYCVMANFFWLLVEGLYLHTLLAVSFFSERKYFWGYIFIGWGVPSTFTMVWTIIRIHFEDYGCWDTIISSLWWIIKAPILASILVNFILFIRIIRILVHKLRAPDVGKSDSSPYSEEIHLGPWPLAARFQSFHCRFCGGHPLLLPQWRGAGRTAAEVAALASAGRLGLGPQIPAPVSRQQRGHVQHAGLHADPRQPRGAPLLQLPGRSLPGLTATCPGGWAAPPVRTAPHPARHRGQKKPARRGQPQP
ncbi:vasoactive intestinal polypeptide receptor 1 isoform X2 [Kogia breviceps]|uniref:vasoactive intestinal polypeptide receptor 1 isoform X2 n=1 Tax=Kogia breviceps TaxID=27615 RepID=UPI0034D30181